jgi:DNA polymerase-3 subunit alpha (Gram-positive type)
MAIQLEKDYIAYDTETTGLQKPDEVELYKQPFMIEIYAYKFQFIKEKEEYKINFVDEFYSLFKPPVPVSEKITEITGITNQELKNAPVFIERYDAICEFFLGSIGMIAHNCSFDRDIICNELGRHGLEYNFPWPKDHICTVEKSQCIQNKRLNLKTLYKIATGKDAFPNAHRAKADVAAMIECVVWMKNNNLL